MRTLVDSWRIGVLCVAVMLSLGTLSVRAQSEPEPQPPDDSAKTKMEIYGFTMLDNIFDFERNDPLWFDVMRPTKLPAFEDEFGLNRHFYQSVRQSRLGVKTNTDTKYGELKTIFEFELFGVGEDAGQTTFRLRHAWGELGHFGGGQYWSTFMDPDIFPNELEYWGPNGIVWFRNVQFRWMPIQGDNELFIAAERPGASGDGGQFADRIELQNIVGRFPAPDLAAHYKVSRGWGHVQIAGLLRRIDWDDTLADPFQLSGHGNGWGVNLTGAYKIDKDTLKLSVTYGRGIENYMNDAPIDVGVELNPGNRVTPFEGDLLPVFGMMAFYDKTWSDKWTSTAGYSRLDINNSDGQLPSDFKSGQYALANLLYYPVPNAMVGGEFQWGQRKNNSDGWSFNDFRIQISVRWNFAYKLDVK
jgi:outer membrane DcaP-like protein